MWQQWTNALLGLAVIVVPFLGFTSELQMWTFALLGIALTTFAVWGAVEHDNMYDQLSERMT